MTVEFANYSPAEREEMAKNGEAMADSSFPIKTREDLKHAIKAYGRASDKPAVKAWIEKRAKALNCEDCIPDGWESKFDATDSDQDAKDSKTDNVEDDKAKEFVEKDARLFVAGKYPKKDMTVSEADLHTIAAGTNANGGAPLKHSHVQDSLTLGTVNDLYVKDSELWGTVRMSKAQAEVVGDSKIKTLSVGLLPKKDRLLEVSLTSNPHIKSAQMFSEPGTVYFSLDDIEENLEVTKEELDAASARMSELETKLARATETLEAQERELAESKVRIAFSETQLAAADVERTLAQYNSVCPPVLRELFKPLLMEKSAVVTFSGEEKSVAEIAEAILKAMPKTYGNSIKFDNVTGLNVSADDKIMQIQADPRYSELLNSTPMTPEFKAEMLKNLAKQVN